MRFRDDTPAFQNRAREAVAQWRADHPQGTPDQMVHAVGPAFPAGCAPALRNFLITVDKHHARDITGVITGQAGAR
jgi:hypothetical protein